MDRRPLREAQNLKYVINNNRMKVLGLIICGLFLFVYSLAQGNATHVSIFSTENWQVTPIDNGIVANGVFYYVLRSDPDTIINHLTYKRLYVSRRGDRYEGALREEGLRVFFVPKGESHESLLYDFGLNVGESIDVGLYGENHTVTVTGVDSVYLYGRMHRRLRMEDEYLQDSRWPWPAYWVEGVGSDLGIISPYGWGWPLLRLRMSIFSTSYPVSRLFEETQDFHMLDGSPCWETEVLAGPLGDILSYFKFSVSRQDDVCLLNGKTYQTMTLTTSHWDGTDFVNDGVYSIGMREEDNRVLVNRDEYIRFISETGLGNPGYIPYPMIGIDEIALYDFSMEEGDVFQHVDDHDDIYVLKVTSLDKNNYRKEFTLSNGVSFLEGKGCISSARQYFAYLNPVEDDVVEERLTGYGKNGIYTDFTFVTPQVFFTDRIQQVKMPNEIGKKDGVYDLQGRKVQTPQRGGLYIQGGKKLVYK